MSESASVTGSTPAVLFLVFNRPDTTARVFNAIRAARPTRLYVAADGARPQREGEQAAVDETRRISLDVDWPCEVKTLFRERNLGCKMAVSSAITWFFEHEPEGIVLEDDCLPSPDFFAFCADMLQRHRSDERVGLVSGTALFDLRAENLLWGNEDYVFSRYFSVWGWASWRRVWRDYDVMLDAWTPRRRDVETLTHHPRLSRINAALFDRVQAGGIDTWDYQVSFMLWSSSRLSIAPRFNLVENIGFGPSATHTTDAHAGIAAQAKGSVERLSFPLTAPSHLLPNRAYQERIERMATRSKLSRIIERLRSYAG